MANEVNYSPCKYTANGVTTEFSFTWKIFTETDLVVRLEDRTTGVQTTLVNGTDYVVYFGDVGGYIAFEDEERIPSSQYYIIISREVPDYQSKRYSTSTGFQGSEIENSFDKVSCNLQEVEYTLQRSIKVPIGSANLDMTLPVPSAGKTLKWNQAETGLINSSIDVDELESIANRLHSSIGNIDTVANSITNVNTVSGSIANVNTVSGSIANVNTVSDSIENVNAVAGNETNINAVNSNKTNIDTVAGISSDVSAVAGVATDIPTVADDLTNVDTVATNISDVSTVAGDISKVSAVADDLTNIDAVNSNKTNIDTVAGSISNVNAVGGAIASVTSVAGDLTNINAVNSNKTNIDTVAGISSNVTTVANNSGIVTFVAVNMSKLNTIDSNITNINNVANDLTTINAVASDLTNIDNASANATLAGKWANYMGGTVDGSEYSAKYYAQQAAQGQIQANWNESDTTAKSYIQNKPEIISYEVTDDTNIELYAWTKAYDSSILYTKATEGEDLTVYAIVSGTLTDISDEGYVEDGDLWYEDALGTEYYATRTSASDVIYKSVKLKDGNGVAIYPEAVWG